MALAEKQLIINAFANDSARISGLFKYPRHQSSRYNDSKHWQALVKKLEAAKFHVIFFADALGSFYKGLTKLEPKIPTVAKFSSNNLLCSITARTAARKSMGLESWPSNPKCYGTQILDG